MAETINAGDVVVLKSGSPKMTVLWVSEGNARLIWYNEATNRIVSDDLAQILLVKAE